MVTKKKKTVKVKRDKSYDPSSEPEFNAEPILMDHNGDTITALPENKVLEHLKPIEETNADKIAREKADMKELDQKIADIVKPKKQEHVEKPIHIQAASPSAQTEGQKIWEEIKNLPIDMFGLQNKRIYEYCKPVDLMPTACFLIQSFSSVLPMLEAAVGKTYVVEMQAKYIMVKRAEKKP